MRRVLLIILLATIVLVIGMTGVAWYLLHDEGFLKQQLNAYMQRNTGRELVVGGRLRLALGRQTTIVAEDARLQNAAWADEPWLARVGNLRVVLDLPSLFSETVLLEQLQVEDCAIHLQENEQGVANWEALEGLGGEDDEEPQQTPANTLPVALLDNRLTACRLTHDAPDREVPLDLEIENFHLRLENQVRWLGEGRGRVNGEPLELSGWLEPAGALIRGGAVEHDLDFRIGRVSLTSTGTVRDVATGAGADIRLRFKGPEFANVLHYFGASPFAEGAFDLELRLDSSGDLTKIEVDGDLGNLKISARGDLDRLVHPTRGTAKSHIEGPDLEAFASALGLPGLVADSFTLTSNATFEPGLIRFSEFRLTTPSDDFALQGALGTDDSWSGTDLALEASSAEVARWLTGMQGMPAVIGAMSLQGRLSTATDGDATIDVRLAHEHNILILNGNVGPLDGPWQPDLRFDYHADDPELLAQMLEGYPIPRAPVSLRGHASLTDGQLALDQVDLLVAAHRARINGQLSVQAPYRGSELDVAIDSPNAAELGALFGIERLPAAPLVATGRLSRPSELLRLEDIELKLAEHSLMLDGQLNLANVYSGSSFSGQLESPDVAELASLFGQQGLPHEPVTLTAEWKFEGKGLEFRTGQGQVGAMRLFAEGRIPDLDDPLVLDANFDVALPSLSMLEFLLDGATLPDLPFTAKGGLRNEADGTRLDAVQAGLGQMQANIDGRLLADRRFRLSLDLNGDDFSELEGWLQRTLVAEPFSLQLTAQGDTGDFELQQIEARLGESRATGDLRIGRADRKRVSGRLESPYIDLSWWNPETGRENQTAASDSPYVFDDTPTMRIADFGIDVDLQLGVARLDLGNTLIQELAVGMLLTRSRLELQPFSLRGRTGGELSGRAVLDGSGARPRLQVEFSGKNVRLGLAAKESQPIETYPQTDVDIQLEATGSTRREMAASLNGRARAFVGSGQVAHSAAQILLTDFLTELFQQLNPASTDDEYTMLECAVIGARATDGKISVLPAVYHLDALTIFSQGSIDLNSEKIDLSFNSKPRKGLGITAGTVINPFIKVGGNLKSPAIELDPAGAVISGGAAVATAGLSIVAKSFADRFLSSRDPCGDARKEIAKQDG